MKMTSFSAIAATCALMGCGGLGTGDPTDSGFARPSASGEIGRTLASESFTGTERSNITGNSFAWEVGAVREDGLQGFAGIVPGAQVSAPQPGQQVSMTGTFEVGVIDFIFQNGTNVSGQATTDRGRVNLVADFGAGTLTGSGTGLDPIGNVVLDNNLLLVDGQINGTELTGTVTYDGVSGPLQGLVGGNEAIGVFHGHDDTQVHAGGFIAN